MKSRPSEVRATLHDVAARARVSIATVSRALNGLPVSARNHERVHKAAQELGYVANEAARALRSDRSQTMGLIFFDLRTTLGIELLDSMSEAIEDAGYSLLISTARSDTRRFDLLMHRFLERRVDALFCIHARGDGETLARYHAAGVPVIAVLDSAGAFAELPLISPSIAEASNTMAKHLAELGHARVALVRHAMYRNHLTTIARALAAFELSVDYVEASEVGGMGEIVAELMGKRNRPTAVIAPGGLAQALLTACDAARIAVPEALSIIGWSRPGADHTARAISSITIDPHRLGRAAGAAMLGWLAGSRPANRLRVELGAFSARGTSGKAPAGQ